MPLLELICNTAAWLHSSIIPADVQESGKTKGEGWRCNRARGARVSAPKGIGCRNPLTSSLCSATIFVSNLPYSATSTDIKTLFSDIGPVRSAFVVLDQTSGVSKGVGYVSFAIREDAQLAHDTVNGGEGLEIAGRKLRVDWAGSKVCTSSHCYAFCD